MKDTLRTRIEFLWAKLAGRDVDIDTLTPDAPTNMVEKLMIETANRITDAEQGGGGGGGMLIVHVNAETGLLDKTWNEINTAFREGILTYIAEDSEEYSYHILSLVSSVSDSNSGGQNVYEVMSGSAGYTALSADDYPHS